MQMEKIKNVLRNIKYYCKYLRLSLTEDFRTKKRKIFLFSVPNHGNLGDHLIVISEKTILHKKYKGLPIIEIPSSFTNRDFLFTRILKKITPNDLVFIHGGGFIGDIWLGEFFAFMKVIQILKNRRIVVFPQTISFSNTEQGKKMLDDFLCSVKNHPSLILCVRDQKSYDVVVKHNVQNVYLFPDMALFLKPIDTNNTRVKKCLFVMRKDKEKMNNERIIQKLQKYFLDRKYIVEYDDTVKNYNIYDKNRKQELNAFFKKYTQYSFVVTDRLHGMIIAYLTNTPCLALNNQNGKVGEVYRWIEKCNYICFTSSYNSFVKVVNTMFQNKNHINFDSYKAKLEELL